MPSPVTVLPAVSRWAPPAPDVDQHAVTIEISIVVRSGAARSPATAPTAATSAPPAPPRARRRRSDSSPLSGIRKTFIGLRLPDALVLASGVKGT